MSEERELIERSLSRKDLLKLGAAGGAAALLGTRAGSAAAALERLTAESGQLQVLDWVGYGNDGGQAMFASYVNKYPKNKPQFSLMNNEADALAKMKNHTVNPDLFRPYVGWVEFFAKSGLVQPWDPKLITNFKSLNPFMVKAGAVPGQAVRDPGRLGLRRHPLPNRQGASEVRLVRACSSTTATRARSPGTTTASRCSLCVGYLFGYKDPCKQTDAQLKQAKDFLVSKKHLARNIWNNEASLDTDIENGNIWIAYAWPNDWVITKAKGKKQGEGRYMLPKEKPISWVGMFMLLKSTPRYHLAHAYVDAWSATKSGKWLEDNYGYGHANTKARPSSSDLLKALNLTNPKAVVEPNAHLDRDVPRRDVYVQLWEEVKRS